MNQPSYESPLGEIYIKTLDGKWKRFKPKLSDDLKDITLWQVNYVTLLFFQLSIDVSYR